jgi:hypothetical protein
VRSTLKQGKGFAASKAQRLKVADMVSIVSAQGPCDPCHLVPRHHGGCDDRDCVIPLTRIEHGAFDDGRLDILPYLIAHGCWAELAHAVAVHHYDPVSLAERCTGDRYVPEPKTNEGVTPVRLEEHCPCGGRLEMTYAIDSIGSMRRDRELEISEAHKQIDTFRRAHRPCLKRLDGVPVTEGATP